LGFEQGDVVVWVCSNDFGAECFFALADFYCSAACQDMVAGYDVAVFGQDDSCSP